MNSPSVERAGAIAGWLQPRTFQFIAPNRTGTQILEAAARLVAPDDRVLCGLIVDALWRREQAGSTAIGHGFAIPHARIAGIERPLTVYLRAAEPIHFDIVGRADPVTHFLVILVPSDGAPDDHLRLLAAVARLIDDRRFRRALDDATTPDAAAEAFRSSIAQIDDLDAP